MSERCANSLKLTGLRVYLLRGRAARATGPLAHCAPGRFKIAQSIQPVGLVDAFVVSSAVLGRPNATSGTPSPSPGPGSCSIGESLGTLHVETSVSVEGLLLYVPGFACERGVQPRVVLRRQCLSSPPPLFSSVVVCVASLYCFVSWQYWHIRTRHGPWGVDPTAHCCLAVAGRRFLVRVGYCVPDPVSV